MPGAAVNSLGWLIAAAVCLRVPLLAQGAEGSQADPGEEIAHGLDPGTGGRVIPNTRCLKCHGDESERTDVRDDGSIVEIYVPPHQFAASEDGDQLCTDCHTTIRRVPHREPPEVVVGCVECHEQTWAEHKENQDPKHLRLGVVVEQIDRYLRSVHARPNKKHQSRTNATCYDCHNAHNIGPLGSEQRVDQCHATPQVCGSCRAAALAGYRQSDHGKAVMDKGDSEAAVCSDCHTSHEIGSPKGDPVMLQITERCGNGAPQTGSELCT